MDFKALRAAKNKKAQSLIESSGGKVDSSDFTPAELLNADAKTGMRPISRRAFKVGGKVEGEKAKTNLSRAPRGFQEKVGLANTNQKDANEEREGVKHVGGFKKGGRAGYQTYGAVDGARLDAVGPEKTGEDTEPMTTNNGRKVSAKQEASFNEAQKQQAAWEAEQRAKGDMTRRKDGGKAEKFEGSAKDMMEDKKMAAKRGMSMKEWEASEADKKHDSQKSMKGLKAGGKADEDHDKDCACKACGGRMARATGGRAGKGKTNIVINVMPHTAAKPAAGIMPPMPPVGGPPPMGGMPPLPPPSGGGGGLPPGLMAAMSGATGDGPMPPQGGAPMPPPMMGRKDGGKVYPKMKFGAGSGKGRLEKIEKYGKNA